MNRLVDALIDWPERTSAWFAWLPPLFARIVVGWVFMWTGWAKLNNLPQITENFIGWGIPFPYVMTPFVSGVEFLGGLLLLLGLFTRLAAPPLVITMVVAIIAAKWDQIELARDAPRVRGGRLHGALRLARGGGSGADFARRSPPALAAAGKRSANG